MSIFRTVNSNISATSTGMLRQSTHVHVLPGADPGFGVRGAKFGEGIGDRLGPQSDTGRSPGRGSSCN